MGKFLKGGMRKHKISKILFQSHRLQGKLQKSLLISWYWEHKGNKEIVMNGNRIVSSECILSVPYEAVI